PISAVTKFVGDAAAGRIILERWLAGCVARTPLCVPSESRLVLVAKAAPETRSSGCARRSKVRSAAAMATEPGHHNRNRRSMQRRHVIYADHADGALPARLPLRLIKNRDWARIA